MGVDWETGLVGLTGPALSVPAGVDVSLAGVPVKGDVDDGWDPSPWPEVVDGTDVSAELGAVKTDEAELKTDLTALPSDGVLLLLEVTEAGALC